MNTTLVPAAELARAYEAARAQATGGMPAEPARGLGVLLARGLGAWMTSLVPLATTTTAAASSSLAPTGASAQPSELASLLCEMALARERRCAA